MIIAFSGMSGTGKTTIIKALECRLKESGHKVIRKVEFDYLVLGHILRIFGSSRVSQARKIVLEGERGTLYKLWLLLVLLDHILAHFYYRVFKSGHIVLFDRYIYDFLVALRLLGSESKFLRWLYYKAPRANTVFVLDAPEEKAYERELSDPLQIVPPDVELYPIMRREYLKIAEDLKLRVVNTAKLFEGTMDEVLSELRKSLTPNLE